MTENFVRAWTKAQIGAYVGNTFIVIILSIFFTSMGPTTHAQIFFQVMLPLAKPGLVSAGIFNFLGQWNQFILSTVLMSNANLAEGQTRHVVSQGMYYLQNQRNCSASDFETGFTRCTSWKSAPDLVNPVYPVQKA